MIYLKLFGMLLANLPALIRMVDAMEKNATAAGVDRKVENDFKIIAEAFKSRDPDALRKLFNS